MKTRVMLSLIAGLVFIYLSTLAFAGPVVPYPEGYRLWTHVKSGIVPPDKPGHGLHNIYANKKALDGFRNGRFENGSVIVFDLLDIDTTTGTAVVGDRRMIDVMHKDDKQFSKTGGWGFEEFRGDSRTQRNIGENAAAKCFACHAGQKERGFVFSSFRE